MELVIFLVGNNDPIILREKEINDRRTVKEIYKEYLDGAEFLSIGNDNALLGFNTKNISLMILDE
ncbi:hypothetical protein CW697_10450 [Macrococcoides caseolyticum]|uniref:hypothetical protein n=1 Tax=Macrococcoides caseolyticum TaxID=69966 RepID=UPI000A28F5D0|nr:hypothetical protein [Macrococcus caseolyticus]ARQ03935.1 hypothetical protein CA207_06800 [Macrococcus caseolyticus]PKF28957.1 hypothetical protein CW697_10450 [Macrococcus caseolyticus]